MQTNVWMRKRNLRKREPAGWKRAYQTCENIGNVGDMGLGTEKDLGAVAPWGVVQMNVLEMNLTEKKIRPRRPTAQEVFVETNGLVRGKCQQMETRLDLKYPQQVSYWLNSEYRNVGNRSQIHQVQMASGSVSGIRGGDWEKVSWKAVRRLMDGLEFKNGEQKKGRVMNVENKERIIVVSAEEALIKLSA